MCLELTNTDLITYDVPQDLKNCVEDIASKISIFVDFTIIFQ